MRQSAHECTRQFTQLNIELTDYIQNEINYTIFTVVDFHGWLIYPFLLKFILWTFNARKFQKMWRKFEVWEQFL